MIIADLHIHSKYSRATSRDCTPEQLDFWARRKGIGLLGTGDFTHAAWRGELKEKLISAEDGLFRLKKEYCADPDNFSEDNAPRFVLSGEISSIYKKNGRVRKVHNVILLPGFEAADLLAAKLALIGNIHSDGRPILGLDSRDLLELTLDVCPEAIFIPAHIWTPHFSLFGAFSGFDAIEECFEDLTPHIHALETGLSADPVMCRRLSALDRYTLVSNSDAHSPAKLGREANLLDIDRSYTGLYNAIQNGEGFLGTVEFFPEEGKYHLDGHRNCNLCLTPDETLKYGGKCPVCGKKITIGVLNRVTQLADRPEDFVLPDMLPFESLVPLPEVIGASLSLSAASKKTAKLYEEMLQKIGPEFYILRQAPIEEIRAVGGVCVAEGIRRLRAGEVKRTPGFDGEYGKICILEDSEISLFSGQTMLTELSLLPDAAEIAKKKNPAPPAQSVQEPTDTEAKQMNANDALNAEQEEAAVSGAPVVLVSAGPGTGKTKTLVSRIVHLISQGVKPREITAVTFTNKAAGEMRQRLEKQIGKRAAKQMTIGTFHAVCLGLLTDLGLSPAIIDRETALDLAKEAILEENAKIGPVDLLQEVSKRKNGVTAEGQLSDELFHAYCAQLEKNRVVDLDDLLLMVLKKWDVGEFLPKHKRRFAHLSVDEFQDINPVQYRLVQAWSQNAKGLFVIGDTDQAIYGFRGSDAKCFDRLREDFPDRKEITLTQNYRCAPKILNAAVSVITEGGKNQRALAANRTGGAGVKLHSATSPLAEGIFVAKQINQMVGGIEMLDTDSAKRIDDAHRVRGFSDIAVLYRTHRQARILEKCFRQESIPYTVAGREDFLQDGCVRGILAFLRFLTEPENQNALAQALKLLFDCSAPVAKRCLAELEKKEVRGAENILAILKEEQTPLCSFALLAEKLLPLFSTESPSNFITHLAENLGKDTDENVKKLIHTAVMYDGISAFLQSVVLGEERDIQRASGTVYSSDAVTLSTLHGSKGLEFPVVFLCGVNDGTIPLEAASGAADIAEERRLFYVGMTRAMDELILSSFGKPSAFLADIPENFTEKAEQNAPAKPFGRQMSLF